MKYKDYSKWVFNEMRESKIFTVLNVIGVWLSVWVVIVFLSLAFGVEKAAINRITDDVNLFTLEVDQRENTPLHFSDFASFEGDPRINQIIPVISEFWKIGAYDSIENATTDATNINENTNVTNIDENINENTNIIYTENHFAQGSEEEDLRTSSLTLIEGDKLTNRDDIGIIVSLSTFEKLKAIVPNLDRDNFVNNKLAILAQRFNASNKKEYKFFECRIVGITDTTPYNGALVYLSFPLAQKIDHWVNFKEPQSVDYKKHSYKRFDLVTNNLADLESLRQDIRDKGYATSSILDRIDGVRQILFIINVVFFLIFGIAILMSGFNIVITLTSSVLKRKHEIGVLKSLGATDLQILNIFVIHAIYLSAFGSFLGVITAYIIIGLTQLILSGFELLNDIKLFYTSISSVILIVIFAIFLSIIASLAPARKAASITPIETLREN